MTGGMKFKISLGNIEIEVEKSAVGRYKACGSGSDNEQRVSVCDTLAEAVGNVVRDIVEVSDLGGIFLQYGKVEDEE